MKIFLKSYCDEICAILHILSIIFIIIGVYGCNLPNNPCPPFCFFTPTPVPTIVEQHTPTPSPTVQDPPSTNTPTKTPTNTPFFTSTPSSTPIPTMAPSQPFQALNGKIEFIVSGLNEIPTNDDDVVIMTSAWEQNLNVPNRNVPVIGIHARAGKFTFRFSNKIAYDQYIYPLDVNAEQCGTGTHPSIAQTAIDGIWTFSWRNNFEFNGEKYGEIIVRSPVADPNETLTWKRQIQTNPSFREFYTATVGTLGIRWRIAAKGTFGLGSWYQGVKWSLQSKRYHAWSAPIWNWPENQSSFTSMVGETGVLIPCPKLVPTATPRPIRTSTPTRTPRN